MGTTSSAGLFTGSSAFSSDLQTAIAKAVTKAAAPITQLSNQQSALRSQTSEISTLGSRFSALQSAVQSIDSAIHASFTASVSDASAVRVTTGAGAAAGSYSIQVNDPGSWSTMMTSAWEGSGGGQSTYQLWIGTRQYSVTAADPSAASVAAAINAQHGDMVNAAVVNVGSDASPDYRLSIQSTSLTSSLLDLRSSGGTSLAATQTAGAPAQYEVNGSGVTASSASRTFNISNGVTVQLLAATKSPVAITVSRDNFALSNALSQFTAAYNATASELANQTGQSGGPLQGQSLVGTLSSALSGLATYSGSGGIASLYDLGLELGSDGQLTFDPSTLSQVMATNASAVNSFLGSAKGGGFLQAATNRLTGIQDPNDGLLPTTTAIVQAQIARLTTQISDGQARVSDLQTQITQQMATADAAISSMEQQYSYLSQMFQAMQVAKQTMAGL